MKVALIGCGQISAAHLSELALIKDAAVVAVCDVVPLLAEDLAERYSVPKWYSDYSEMLDKERPDVVHITVPPAYQKEIALNVIRKGRSVYIEKPFCINLQDTVEVIETAKTHNALACAGFFQVYDKAPWRFRQYRESGKLGSVVHVESYYGNDMGGSFAKAFLQNKAHWIHSLPGKLFQNVISHALAQVAPFFKSPLDNIACLSIDRSRNGMLEDELRVMILSGDTTGYITFSSSARPVVQFTRIYGTKSIADIDLGNHIFSYVNDTKLPGPLARIRNAFMKGKQMMLSGFDNSYGFLSGNDRFFTGMGGLFAALYKAIKNGDAEPPIPYNDVLVVAEILDRISDYCSSKTPR